MIDMSKLSDLSKLVNMRLPSIEIPDDWEQDLRQAALKAGARSITAYLQKLVAKDLGKEPVLKTWGGKRQVKQDEQIAQDAHVEQDEQNTTKPDPPKTVVAIPEPPDPVVTPASVKGNIPAAPDIDSFLKAAAAKTATTTNPNQIIAERRKLAAEKHPAQKPLNGKGK